MAKALLDNPVLFTVFMLSTRGCRAQIMQALPTPARTGCCNCKIAAAILLRFVCILSLLAAGYAAAFPKSNSPDEAPKLMFRLEAPEADALAAVQQVSQDQIVHGTYSYEKEHILYGAHSAEGARVFGTWKGPGKVFYKVAGNVLSPRYFKDTGDIGTISIRYVVQSVDANATTVQIDALYVDARNVKHVSLGNVEASEFSAIQQHLRTIQSKTEEAAQKSSPGTSFVAAAPVSAPSTPATNSSPAPANLSVPAMQKHLDALRHQVELRVKDSGAQLKASPFHSSATLASLPGETEVLVVVLTPYWYGVETDDGHRGWIHHSQLEPLP
jgi:hypothetical protein